MQTPEESIPEEVFGRRLKQLREACGMTQEELTEAVGIKDSRTIRYWEAGVNAPKFSNLVALAKALKVRMQDLFVFPDEPDL